MLRLLDDEADLGVISSYTPCGNGLECQEFFDDTMVLIVPSGHPWAQRTSVEPADLLDEPMIVREPSSGTRRVMLTELAKHDITLSDLHILLELGNAEAIVHTVQAGYGIAFVSRLAAEWALGLGVVTAVAVNDLHLRRKLYMVRPTLSDTNRARAVCWNFVHHPDNADLLHTPEAGP